ncbi:MAG TPA: sulfate ABC transporter substrate-binding protein [Gaiellaceae bacterium]
MRRISGRYSAAVAAAVATAIALIPQATAATSSRAGGSISLVAYSTPKEAYGQIISAFQKTKAGQGVSFQQSYAGSTEQAQAVVNGLHADVVALSLEPDITTLVKAGLVKPSWSKDRWHGIVTRSVVVFVLRNGNPKHIRDWEDLVKPGVQVVTPNPLTSGGARWNVMAAYGAMIRKGKTHKQAVAYLKKLFQHTVSQDKSAREALQTFLTGRGDVLLSYENEAILAQRKNQPVYYLIPKATIRIENPVAVTSNASDPAAARAFVAFLHTPTAQTIYGDNGYRPVDPKVIRQFNYPVRPWLFTIQRFGGWAKVQKQFFDPKTGIVTKIEEGLGH